MNNFKKIVVSMIVTAFTLLIMLPAIAIGKPKVIFFYTTWNAKSRAAKPVVEQVVNSYGGSVDLVELDMDNANITDEARVLGVNIPASVPYIVVLDQNGKVVGGSPVAGQSYIQLKGNLDQYLGK